MVGKNRFFQSLLIMSTIMMMTLIPSGNAMSADDAQIIVGENLMPGMTLKEAIELLGPPENIEISDTGTLIIPYDTLGLSIETMRNETVIEGIHLKQAFKGKFSSGIGIGAEYQEILSAYDQPDIMTKEIIEYSESATIFRIDQGKLVGADLYAKGSKLFHRTPSKGTGVYVAKAAEKKEVKKPEIREEEKVDKEGTDAEEAENEEAYKDEDEETEVNDNFDVFELFGFNVRTKNSKVIITEVRPGSVAEQGGLKKGEFVRKAFYKGLDVRNIYTVGGLKALLKRAINKRKKVVHILQSENYFYKVQVPKRD